MEKQAKPKNMILRFLPKAAAAVSVSFQNPPFSPGRDKHKGHHHAGRGFSGPITVSIIPDEARRKTSKSSTDQSFGHQEPTSPKVSCMGQIKHKKITAVKKAKRVSPPPASGSSSPGEVKKQHASKLRRIFSMAKPSRKSDASSSCRKTDQLPDQGAVPPCLGQMKRFASRRDAFSSFDWMAAQIAPEEEGDHRDYYSDEERRDSDVEEEDVIIPFSAPMAVGGGRPLQPRKEINLWKRRTINPLKPLQLNPMVTAN